MENSNQKIIPRLVSFESDESAVYAIFEFTHKGSHTDMVFTAHTGGKKDIRFIELEEQAVNLFQTVLAKILEKSV